MHVVVVGSFNVDAYRPNTPDVSEFKGHFYSDKAPGTAAMALPAFAASTLALRVCGVGLDSDSGWLASSWIACAGSIGITTALGAALLFCWLSKRAAPKSALVTTLAIFLGAAPLPYATMMFSHALVVGLLAVALWAMARRSECGVRSAECGVTGAEAGGRRAEAGGRRGERGLRHWASTNRWDLLAGFACGWALASEYTAGIVLVGLFLWLASQGWRRVTPFCVAAVPPLLLIPAYSWACFGNPFVLPYSLSTSFPAMKEGLYAIKWPDAETAYNLLFSPTRGLFFWTPFLFVAGAGYGKLKRTNRGLLWLAYAAPLLQIIVISGRAWDWQAGPTLGPRLLAPILPLLALPCALGVQRFPRTGMALAAYSILITTLATLTNAAPPASYYNPLTELHIPLLLKGRLAPNLGTACGLSPWLSVALYYAILVAGICWLWRLLPQDSPASPNREAASLRGNSV
ncbi:MAG: hypothetical protein ACLQVX_25725 [Limisphaerales bacterium]